MGALIINYGYIHKKKEMEICISQKNRTGQKVDHTYDNSRLKEIVGDYRFITPQEALHTRISKNGN